jgi:hypothetical protein
VRAEELPAEAADHGVFGVQLEAGHRDSALLGGRSPLAGTTASMPRSSSPANMRVMA